LIRTATVCKALGLSLRHREERRDEAIRIVWIDEQLEPEELPRRMCERAGEDFSQ
jgi:hypothetical protein